MFAAAIPKGIPSLDGIRAVAVLLVVVSHAAPVNIVPGGFGVTIFFFLSGFLITSLFLKEASTSGRIDLPAFYLRRILRLTPPLFITLAFAYAGVAAGLVPGEFHWETVAAQSLYLYNYHWLFWQQEIGPPAMGTGVLWSLAIEEHFYLLYPPLLLALLAMRRPASRIAVLAAILALFLVWRLVLAILLGASSDYLYAASDARFDSILYGCLLAFMMNAGAAERVFPSGAGGMAAMTAAGLALLLLTFLWRDQLFRDTLRYSIQGVALMPLFYYAVRRPEALHHRVLNTPAMTVIGAFSYTIYLIHYVLMGSIAEAYPALKGTPLNFLLSFGGSFLYAWAMYRFVETPVARLRRRVSAHHGAAAAPSAG
jgi:peptidoglycan/LPS O-acetylase OafA/YrhL